MLKDNLTRTLRIVYLWVKRMLGEEKSAQTQPTIAIVDEGCWYPDAESQRVLSLGRTAPTHIHEVDASK